VGRPGRVARGVGAGRGVRAGRESREEWGAELGRAGGSGPSERGVSWAGERKERLGCCWAGVGPREGRGWSGLGLVGSWAGLEWGLGLVEGFVFYFYFLFLFYF